MRNFLSVVVPVLGLILAGPSLSMGQVVLKGTGVSQSLHNMNNAAGANIAVKNSEVCRPCHTPHNVITNQDYLWNRAAPAATYTLYNVAHPYTNYTANYGALDSGSKLCLSCHDGAIGVDNYGGATTNLVKVNAANLVGNSGNLRNDHPVGLSYPGLSADGKTFTPQPGYQNPTLAAFTADGNGTAKGVQLIYLPSGAWGVGCHSCHDSHNTYDATQGNFLRTSMKYSFLCLKCHDK